MKTKTLLGALAIIGLLSVRAGAQVSVSTAISGGLAEPYNVVEDAGGNIYISDSANNRIAMVDANTQVISTLAGVPGVPGSNDGPSAGFNPAHFNDPQGLLAVSIGGTNGLLVTDSGGFGQYPTVNTVRFVRFSDGNTVTLAGNTNAPTGAVNADGVNASFNVPAGMAQDTNGNVYIADEFDNTIRVMNLNDPAFGVTNLVLTDGTTFHHPNAVAYAGNNQLWVADSYNNSVKLITLTTPTTGTLTTYIGSNNHRTTGTADSAFGPTALFNNPSGLFWVSGVGLLISDTGNNSIRLATNNPTYGVTNYSVITFAGTIQNGVGQPGLVNGSALSAEFKSPEGICQDPANNAFLVADLANNAIRRIQNGAPLPAVPTPSIGWVAFHIDANGNYTSILQTASPFVFNNDVTIAINPNSTGTQVHYTYGPTPANPLLSTIPNPSPGVGSTPPVYADGLTPSQVPGTLITPPLPDMTIEAIGFQNGRQNSAIASARFQFQTATPAINGNNAAQFTVTDITTNAVMYYTTDGSTPTNDGSGTSIGPVLNGATLSLIVTSNLTFNVAAFRDNYANSSVATKVFSVSNFVADSVSFGFSSGEASSTFIAAAGQMFVAPVTLTVLPNTKMYSLQFNLTVTNNGSDAVAPGAVGFLSTLEKPNPFVQGEFLTIPPAMFLGYVTNQTVITNIVGGVTNLFTNSVPTAPINPPPTNLVIYPFGPVGSTPFLDLEFLDDLNGMNLIGVGWLERAGSKILYDTTTQDLITYSQAHDVTYLSANGKIEVGDFGFQVPPGAALGETYQIQVARPSATSDGIGAPGSAVYIATPTNGSLTAGAINSIKTVTVGQLKYIVGDVYPFRWFNAGDFGETNLHNADVEQVFESAIYNLDYPPYFMDALGNIFTSDFFDAMDSCGGLGVLDQNAADANFGYYTNAGAYTNIYSPNNLFYGNDSTINQIAFGDGVLDVCDVYVTFRRSLDPTLTWFQRFWSNGARVAQTAGNIYQPGVAKQPAGGGKIQPAVSSVSGSVSITNMPSVNFAAGDFLAAAGQTFSIPITASVFGQFPLRVAMLNITVVPLDGSPALTTPISFSPGAALGTPTITTSIGPANYAAAWLDSTIAGIPSSATIGTLTITIPTNATSLSSYAVHFDHASGSPNGLASFPKRALTGLITLSSRTNSYYSDGIPDSWRLRYFGTIYNLLSVSNADADGTPFSNWKKYIAGLDPTDPTSKLAAGLDQPMAQSQQDSVIDWPSVSGKTYVIQRSQTLFPAVWTPISTNSGTGGYMEIHDTSGGNNRYYRVSAQ